MTDVSSWPITTQGTDWDDECHITTSDVVCDAYIPRGEGFTQPCHTALCGSTLAEVQASLERHISVVVHVDSPHLKPEEFLRKAGK